MLEILKWIGTACVIIAAGCRALEFHTADLLISILGAGLWGYASIVMRDKPLFVVNACIVVILLSGIIF
jgi:ABC-type microcin C transport system permease subunit YejB